MATPRFAASAALAALLGGCASRTPVPAPTVAIPGAPSAPLPPERCTRWPLEHGCVTGLARGADMLCAVVGEGAFCWGPGAKARSPNGDGIFSPSPADLDAIREAGAAPPTRGVRCEPGPDPSKLFLCTIDGGFGFYIAAASAFGLASRDDVRRIALGNEQACVLARGKVHCYGGSWSSLRGQHEAPSFGAPNEVAIGLSTDLVALGSTTCALASGDVYCWGRGSAFPPGSLPRSPRIVDADVVFDNGGAATLACVLAESGAVACGEREDLRPVPALDGAEELAALAGGEVCARLRGGRVACVNGNLAVRELLELEPASRLSGTIPCAVIGGEVRCARWEYSDNGTTHAFEPVTLRRLGATRGLVGLSLGGRPAACAITERGTVACWGITGFDWSVAPRRHGGDQPIIVDRAARTPTELSGPRDAVEITRGGCVRTRKGDVWIVAGATPRGKDHVRLAAGTAKGASGAVSLLPDQACGGRRADQSTFVLVPDWPIIIGPAPFGPVRMEAPDAPAYPALGGRDQFRMSQNLVCAFAPDAGLRCQQDGRGDGILGPVFDPLARSTLPLRVIPAGADVPGTASAIKAPFPAEAKSR